jgi:hypothetical protein
MLTPPDVRHSKDGTEILFVRRWNTLVDALIIEPSIKHVARASVDFGLADGAGIYPGNELLARKTGYTRKTVGEAWDVLRALEMAERVIPSYYDGRKRVADEYQLAIPGNWRGFAVYGPNMKRFHCQHCGKVFNPKPCLDVRPDGTFGWYLAKAVFCPSPRHGPDCFQRWEHQRRAAKRPLWDKLGDKRWDMFYAARSDEWPPAASEPSLLRAVTAADPWAS